MKFRSLVLAFSATVCLAQATAPAKPQDPADRIVATINGDVLTQRQFELIWSRLSPQMRENYEKAGGKIAFLDTYIKRQLLIQEALKDGYDKRPDVAVDLRIARDSALFDRYVKEVVASQIVSDATIRAFYEENKTEFWRGEMIRARHILATPTDAPVTNSTGDNARSDEEALEKIKKIAMMFRTVGGDFGDVARKFSEDGTAPSGGDLGWFGHGQMVPEFDRIAFTLVKPGETSGVVKTEFGYHVIQLVDKKPAGPAPFEEVKDQIRERMLHEQQAKVIEEVTRLTNELRAASRIAVYPDNL